MAGFLEIRTTHYAKKPILLIFAKLKRLARVGEGKRKCSLTWIAKESANEEILGYPHCNLNLDFGIVQVLYSFRVAYNLESNSTTKLDLFRIHTSWNSA
jgi:hypothetical protein